MRDTQRDTTRTHRYETFVVRLWIEDDGGIEHGEIRHVRSNAARRFREIRHALSFIRTLVDAEDGERQLTTD